MSLDAEAEARARALLRDPASHAFADGHAPVLLRALDRSVATVLVADRAASYVTILYGMLLLRRAHELEPLHEDLERSLSRPLALVETGRDEQALARDFDQLVAWGCLERRAEPLKIRGYKDQRRERYRYRLTDDAVALLDWLEARLEARLEGRADDGRDRLSDVVGHLRELLRIVSHWHKGERGDDAPRRAMYLLTRVDDRVHAITEELLAFRATMLAFASRPYDLGELHRILAWLERYVSVYLSGIEALRVEIVSRFDELVQPRFLRALDEQHALLLSERAETPAAFRGGSVLREPRDLLEAQRPFFASGGRLSLLCARIDESARAVLRKMHRHLRELERRSARRADIVARLDELRGLPVDRDTSEFANAVVASAHARFGSRGGPSAQRLVPPLPRRHAAPAVDREGRPPLRPKQQPPELVRELRARRLHDLARWIDAEVLRGAREARLSSSAPTGPDAPRRWLDVARARHLDRARDLSKLSVAIDDADGEVRVGDDGVHLVAKDCVVRKVAP